MKKAFAVLSLTLILAFSFVGCGSGSGGGGNNGNGNNGNGDNNTLTITTIAGTGTAGYSGDGGIAINAELNNPYGIAVDASGNVYIADMSNNRIRKVDTSGNISTFAGNGTGGYSGDGVAAVNTKLYYPYRVAVDVSGNVIIADYANHRIRKVNSSGIITTIAGTGIQGYSGDGGQATSAQLSEPRAVAVDASGNVYIVTGNRIRRVNSSGIITTIAGTGGIGGYSGDGGLATNAELCMPEDVAVDASGNVYITDTWNNRIRKVNSSGIITTIAGTGIIGYSGDGGAATAAKLFHPYGITVDVSGNIYIADAGNNRIRKVNSAGIIATIAGTGTSGYSGDGGPAISAKFSGPGCIKITASGSIYIADLNNQRIRKLQ
jgi:sugar lactone lactonase YvrE